LNSGSYSQPSTRTYACGYCVHVVNKRMKSSHSSRPAVAALSAARGHAVRPAQPGAPPWRPSKKTANNRCTTMQPDSYVTSMHSDRTHKMECFSEHRASLRGTTCEHGRDWQTIHAATAAGAIQVGTKNFMKYVLVTALHIELYVCVTRCCAARYHLHDRMHEPSCECGADTLLQPQALARGRAIMTAQRMVVVLHR
jgi:hypothetical protein